MLREGNNMHVRLLRFILGVVVVWNQCQGGVFFS